MHDAQLATPELLNELEARWRKLALPIVSRLRPGLRVWLPFGKNDHGGLAVFDCANAAEIPTPVNAVDWTSMTDELQPKTPTLGVLVTWWIDAFDSGEYRTRSCKWRPGHRREAALT